MTRHVNWQRRLRRVIETAREKPHDWNGHCCASFAMKRCYFAVTGRLLPCNYFFKTYANDAEAAEVLAQMGCADIEDLAETFLERHTAPGLIRRGDIGVFLNASGQKVLCIWCGHLGAAPGTKTMIFVPRARIVASFKVD
jgi:hypothetical protein